MPKLRWVLALLALAPLAATHAQTPPPASQLATSAESRANALPQLLAEGAALEPAFTPDFFAAVPLRQLRDVFASLRAQHGAPQRLVSFAAGSAAGNGTAIIAYERANVTITLAVDATGRIAGLRIIDVATRDDSLDRLTRELAALPGTVGWGLYRLHADRPPEQITGARNDQSLAIGSSFKLAVLGALDQEITAGRMRWGDVITLDRPSVPSGMTQDWPHGTPMTVQSAAQLMIAISDNTATDLLIRHLGRERIEAFARAHGGLSGPRAFPLLTTIEATVLKNPALGEARRAWLGGNETQRRAALTRFAPLFVPANVDYGAFARPADIDRIEWFASADSLASLLSWYAHSASDTARAIIAVNAGIPSAAAGRWAYVGYKGGSEPGVMAMNLLLRDADGNSYAVVMSWNNENASVEESRLSGMATRAAELLRTRR
jgi:beta-lactamase class A